MAGMLPGVECARRRRFHQSGTMTSDSQNCPQGWTRRPSFCLYTTNYHVTSTSFPQRGMLTHQGDDKLGVEAREAKERLDERLRSVQRKSEPKRKNEKSNNAEVKGEEVVKIYEANNSSSSKKSGGTSRSKGFMKWGRFSWKACEQEECTICLEGFKGGDSLVSLPCAHRFHNACLLPWLDTNSHCPCCRLGIVS